MRRLAQRASLAWVLLAISAPAVTRAGLPPVEARDLWVTAMQVAEPSAWNRYGAYIRIGALVLVAQMALIAALLIQRAQRRRAETQFRRSQAQLRASYDRIRDLGSRLLQAQDDEQARIARELHDDIGQQLAILAVDLDLLNGAVPVERQAQVGEVAARTQAVAASVHALSHRLHPAKLRLVGLVAALHALQREMSRPDLAVTFTHEAIPPALPPDVTLCLYRVVQEALQNAVKYSGARHVSVALRGEADGLRLTVADDGVGFDVERAWGEGLGLMSMSERIEAAGGTLEIRSTPGLGTRLEGKVPLPGTAAGRAAAM